MNKIKKIMCFLLLFSTTVATKAYGIILPDVLCTHNVAIALAPQKVYDGHKLFEYINGGADVYFNYGFKTCCVCRYGIKNSPGSEFKVNVYNMGKKINAFGIFREFFDSHTIVSDIGSENVSGDGYCYFWKQSFYVEVEDISKTKLKEGLCREIAQEVAKILSGTNDMPIELKWLPEHRKVKGSEGYCMKNYLSRSFLNNVIYADYLMENINCTLFILIGDSEDETRGIFTKLNKIYQTKDKSDRKTGLSTLPYIFTDELHAVCDGNRIVGVVGKCSSESKSTLIKRCLQDSSLSSVPKPQ